MLRKEHELGTTIWAIWCSEVRVGKLAARVKKSVCLQHGDGEYASLQTYEPECAFDDEASAVSALLTRLNNELSRTHSGINNCLQRMTQLAGVKTESEE